MDQSMRFFRSFCELTGLVLSEDQKKFAGRVAKEVPGVVEVANEIALKK